MAQDTLRSALSDTSVAVTHGIRIEVRSMYLAEQSDPSQKQYVWAYTIRIKNEGTQSAQLKTRRWSIVDALGREQIVEGDGVVGAQPNLSSGEEFRYTSGCPLATASGTMRGHYTFVRDDGSKFEAQIAPFALRLPTSLN